jgi:hypothetical protein
VQLKKEPKKKLEEKLQLIEDKKGELFSNYVNLLRQLRGIYYDKWVE